ncbi:MAG: SAM-dependent methyltransferase [Bdellovibrionota bacterium]|nr:SAM-dependent methyltransferase [Bdellovibrionota bacterium]
MALYIVATPIGNPQDISLQALEVLKKVEVVIGEEPKACKRILSNLKLGRKELYFINEHSDKGDSEELLDLIRTQDVALISDCGTPGFCDPGHLLVKAARDKNLKIKVAPGASSLMYLLSLSSQRIDEFYFLGFPPAKSELRAKKWQELANFKVPVFFLETPYRLEKTLNELKKYFPKRKVLIGLNLSQENEQVYEGSPLKIPNDFFGKKAEPIVLIY